MGTPKRQRVRASAHKASRQPPPSAATTIRKLRQRLDTGVISESEFRMLMRMEERRNEWAAQVMLKSLARELIGDAAKQARAGRSRLLNVVGNILLASESTRIKLAHKEFSAEEQYQMAAQWLSKLPRPSQTKSIIEQVDGLTTAVAGVASKIDEHEDKLD
ncbi:MAG TPA: hypothetical protein VGR81_08695 [Candidatus Acidoferrales bacterium]|nr:hypothetical protein [Candidatus Acidoferrales bacterium]